MANYSENINPKIIRTSTVTSDDKKEDKDVEVKPSSKSSSNPRIRKI